VLVGLGAVLAALGTGLNGCQRTDLSPVLRQLEEIRAEQKRQFDWIDRNHDEINRNSLQIQQNRASFREIDARLESLE